MHEAVDEMARAETFRGYRPETGCEFLVTELIAAHDYGERGVKLAADEIVVSDGAKSDTRQHPGDLRGRTASSRSRDPVYPAYVDSNVMAGRAGHGGRERSLRPARVPAVHGRERLPARASRTGRST